MTIDPEIVKQDAEQLQQTYKKTISDLDQTWRALYLERNPRRIAHLEKQARSLEQAARIAAGRHELASRAAASLENPGHRRSQNVTEKAA